MIARAPVLENFGRPRPFERRGPDRPQDEALDLLLARARGQARADGFADGVAQTEARIERELEALLEGVAAAIELARADRAAAERAAEAKACAVARAVLGALAPRLAALSLQDDITAALADAFRAAPGARPVIEVAPHRRDELEAALAARAAGAEIVGAADLGETEARLRWAGGFDLIDAGAAASRALAILDAHLAADEQAAPECDPDDDMETGS